VSSSQSRETPSEPEPKRRMLGPIVLALIGIYLVLLVVLNSNKVKLNFVVGSAKLPLLVALLLAGALGFSAGWVVHGRRARGSR
jgi:uncharacterized integral membrane protein